MCDNEVWSIVLFTASKEVLQTQTHTHTHTGKSQQSKTDLGGSQMSQSFDSGQIGVQIRCQTGKQITSQESFQVPQDSPRTAPQGPIRFSKKVSK